MNRALVVALGLSLNAAGCTITAVSAEPELRTRNDCSADSDCPSGKCDEGLCQTLNGELEALLFEVTPNSASPLAHVQFLRHIEDLPTSGGKRNLEFTDVTEVSGRLQPDPAQDCLSTFYRDDGTPYSASNTSVPITLTLSPRERVLGLSAQVYSVRSAPNDVGDYVFNLAVPAGEYDVYMAPPAVQAGCQVPPQLLLGQRIGGGKVLLVKTVAKREPLTVEVHWPASSGSLDGWSVDIVDPLSGNPISSRVVLAGAATINRQLVYTLPLAYSPVAVAEDFSTGQAPDPARELLRFTPPAGAVAPTVYLERSGIGLFTPNKLEVSGFSQVPRPVRIEGQLAALESGKPARGTVTLVSSAIQGVDVGIFASYQREVSVDEDGRFEVDLPPGTYRVYALPPIVDGLAAYETEWEVPSDVEFQAGKVLELPSLASLTGQVYDPRSMDAMRGAQVQMVPAPQDEQPFYEGLGAPSFVPRASTGLVQASGNYELKTDPGVFDVSIRAPEALGFAWFVRPALELGPEGKELAPIPLPLPFVVTGSTVVEVTGVAPQPVPSALIRAYAYLDENMAYTPTRSRARSVIQVAETRADENGNFRLLLPPKVATPSD